MSVPIATSPGRSGFGPQLSVTYDSGAGNGPFGFGWSLSLPSITRKTDKGLPRYHDQEESDVFLLSGSEDLVPVLVVDDAGRWVPETLPPRRVGGQSYRIRRYRPRIEGLFARIERWTNVSDVGDSFWRTISRDNVTTWYGRTSESRVSDPTDPARIFQWQICESHDDKGHVVVYGYKAEDSARILEDASGNAVFRAHERNRDTASRSSGRYLKRVRYGNRAPYFPELDAAIPWPTPPAAAARDGSEDWLFEVVFDFGEHDTDAPTPVEAGDWPARPDPFSSYRAGFEVRTYRLCRRVLMFHHFPGEAGVDRDCLVRSTDFSYSDEANPTDTRSPVYSFLTHVTHASYRRNGPGYDRATLPPVTFTYSEPVVQDRIEEVDPSNLENLPMGLDGRGFRWVDLHGEGIPGILAEQGGAWYYKRNQSPLGDLTRFAPLETVASHPNVSLGNGADFMDMAGNGHADVVTLQGPMAGLFEHDHGEDWLPFRPLAERLTRDLADPNLKFIDLDGDGRADVLVTEEETFVWHASHAEQGFGPAQRIAHAIDEERGPRVVFADGTQSIHLADFSGDGLTDIVRIRNGEVCYWPNLGYGRFGARVAMDNAPRFDHADQFDPRLLRLADIDGSGTTDIIYLHRDGVQLYFNQSGNSWSRAQPLRVFPRIDDVVNIVPVDLLGSGTVCLVWSSPLPGDAQRPMRYVNLMGRLKPHLLIGVANNLGAETRVEYAPSTKFYLQDKRDGKAWITRLPFPVHVVERVEIYDHISRNRFVTRYAYHHGYFDGFEREFRGFGMVEQFDTEEFSSFAPIEGWVEAATNLDPASHVPPVVSKTWFHTGAFPEGPSLLERFAGEYYRPPATSVAATVLAPMPDIALPAGLSIAARRDAVRALKGTMLRQEVYALDGTGLASIPYVVNESRPTMREVQPALGGKPGVYFTHPRDAVSIHYERNPDDPRIQREMALEVDDFGNVLTAATIGFGRLRSDPELSTEDQARQAHPFATCAENTFTRVIDEADVFRTPLPARVRQFELVLPEHVARASISFEEVFALVASAGVVDHEQPAPAGTRRLLAEQRTTYRSNDLSESLPLGESGRLALPDQRYQLALTPALLAAILDDRVSEAMVMEGGYVRLAGAEGWWIPSGTVRFSPGAADTAATELAHARRHFFLPHRVIDPFGAATLIAYDAPYNLLPLETTDALGNRATAGHRNVDGTVASAIDYRVLQPALMTDPNGNRSAVSFDALGLVAGTAVMGKPGEAVGDLLDGFRPDLAPAEVEALLSGPAGDAARVALAQASTRIVYDTHRYLRTGEPGMAMTLTRETHTRGPAPAGGARFQVAIGYSDGFGRSIQAKALAEPDPDTLGPPISRWITSGWVIHNNKGKPVRQYEPFFSTSHQFEFGVTAGVSPILFYDPVERVVATLHPNHTFEKIVVDPWRQAAYDVNDTLLAEPMADPRSGAYFERLPATDVSPSWYATALAGTSRERDAAIKTEVHADTPTVSYFDSLGRPFLVRADNGSEGRYETRTELDLEGRSLRIVDPRGNTVMDYRRAVDDAGTRRHVPAYDLAGRLLYQKSMDAGERWMLPDIAGQPLYGWDSNGPEGGPIEQRVHRTVYDALRRVREAHMRVDGGVWQVVSRTVWGEETAEPETLNLRGQAFQQFDPSGLSTSLGHDFKGNALGSTRRLVAAHDAAVIDWSEGSPSAALMTETFTQRTEYDALNRMTRLWNWHRSPDRVAVYEPQYNQRGELESEELILGARATPAGPVGGERTRVVAGITRDAKGQLTRMRYGNGTMLRYDYDPLTFRLTRLRATREADGALLQDVSYVYDPVGNISSIRDDAQQTVYFANAVVEPHQVFEYDALYRLVRAEGREHAAQNNVQRDHRHFDPAGIGIPFPNSPDALQNYVEQYVYDSAGNILAMSHTGGRALRWSRRYQYAADSNRLLATSLPGDAPDVYSMRYAYDLHGSMQNVTASPGLQPLTWDWRDMIRRADLGGGGTAYYAYDGSKQRTRKLIQRDGATREERLYLGGMEVYRRWTGARLDEEIETHHLFVGETRVLLVDDVLTTDNVALGTGRLVKYQLGNHLGSVGIELDDHAAVISYEEFHPYGTTAYQAGDVTLRATAKRYRYTGMERDEETGVSYHTKRCYCQWLARWCSVDPMDLTLSFAYSDCNPLAFTDRSGTQAVSTNDRTDPLNFVSLADFGRANPDQSIDVLTEVWNQAHPNELEYGPPQSASGSELLEYGPPLSAAGGSSSADTRETGTSPSIPALQEGVSPIFDSYARGPLELNRPAFETGFYFARAYANRPDSPGTEGRVGEFLGVHVSGEGFSNRGIGIDGEANLGLVDTSANDSNTHSLDLEVNAFRASAGAHVYDSGFRLGGGLTAAGFAVSVGDISVEDEGDERIRFGLSLNVGGEGRVHNTDVDADGLIEVGFGFDLGPVSFDYRREEVSPEETERRGRALITVAAYVGAAVGIVASIGFEMVEGVINLRDAVRELNRRAGCTICQ